MFPCKKNKKLLYLTYRDYYLGGVPGRNKKMYRAGIDLGGTTIKAGIIDENQKILAQMSAPTKAECPAEEVIADIAALVRQLMDTLDMDERMLAGVGVGCPGLVDADAGIVRYSNNISWENVALAKELGTYFSCEIRISNDASCAGLGEVKGVAVWRHMCLRQR